jgi:hypothetical protein
MGQTAERGGCEIVHCSDGELSGAVVVP